MSELASESVVTGAANGIGRGSAERLAADGRRVGYRGDRLGHVRRQLELERQQ